MQKKRWQPLLRACWGIACVVVIIGSLLPADSTPIHLLSILDINDKVEHFCAYTVLGLLPTVHEKWRRLWLLLVLMVALGIALEYGQLYSPGRAFEIADMVADASGVLVGFLIGLLLRRRAMGTSGLGAKTD